VGRLRIGSVVRSTPFALLGNSRKTDCHAGKLRIGSAVRAAPFALLGNSRKTECHAGKFRSGSAVRAAPFALLSCVSSLGGRELRQLAQSGHGFFERAFFLAGLL
jgi:hypothetical protein